MGLATVGVANPVYSAGKSHDRWSSGGLRRYSLNLSHSVNPYIIRVQGTEAGRPPLQQRKQADNNPARRPARQSKNESARIPNRPPPARGSSISFSLSVASLHRQRLQFGSQPLVIDCIKR